jgi:hypothetical protein
MSWVEMRIPPTAAKQRAFVILNQFKTWNKFIKNNEMSSPHFLMMILLRDICEFEFLFYSSKRDELLLPTSKKNVKRCEGKLCHLNWKDENENTLFTNATIQISKMK